ncbi:MAG: bile acid:sodium symporter family protein [Saprospiraceae bacterium]|nr:bile acid:sodium symporter family protein [Saprospiraceae bacterium]
MQEIDKVIINFDEGQLFLLNICLGFLMFGVALDLSLRDFRKILQRPKPVILGLTSQLILLPLLTLLIIFIAKPPFSIQLGMLLVAACPGGNISNYFVHRSHGNTALSITLTSIVTLAAVLITPFSFYLWTKLLQAPPDFARLITVDFWNMIRIIIQLIVFPLILGMALKKYLPRFTQLISKPVKWFSVILLLGIIFFALTGNTDIIQSQLQHVFLLVLLHNGIAYILGYQFARRTNLSHRDARAIAMETGIQNGGLALILIFNYFDGLGGMALVAAWWGVWDIISGFALSSYWARAILPSKGSNQLSDLL